MQKLGNLDVDAPQDRRDPRREFRWLAIPAQEEGGEVEASGNTPT